MSSSPTRTCGLKALALHRDGQLPLYIVNLPRAEPDVDFYTSNSGAHICLRDHNGSVKRRSYHWATLNTLSLGWSRLQVCCIPYRHHRALRYRAWSQFKWFTCKYTICIICSTCGSLTDHSRISGGRPTKVRDNHNYLGNPYVHCSLSLGQLYPKRFHPHTMCNVLSLYHVWVRLTFRIFHLVTASTLIKARALLTLMKL